MTAPKNNERENKPQPSLIPLDLLIKILEPAYREGLIKYRRESWREGFHTTVMMDAALRHLADHFHKGEDFDPDAKKLGVNKTHLGGALFSILCMADTMLHHPELDNRLCKINPALSNQMGDPPEEFDEDEDDECPICGELDCERGISKDGRC